MPPSAASRLRPQGSRGWHLRGNLGSPVGVGVTVGVGSRGAVGQVSNSVPLARQATWHLLLVLVLVGVGVGAAAAAVVEGVRVEGGGAVARGGWWGWVVVAGGDRVEAVVCDACPGRGAALLRTAPVVVGSGWCGRVLGWWCFTAGGGIMSNGYGPSRPVLCRSLPARPAGAIAGDHASGGGSCSNARPGHCQAQPDP